MMPKVYLLLGTNVGNRLENLNVAFALIESKIGIITTSSSIYETVAWGNTQQQAFLNQAIVLETEFAILDLLKTTQTIETTIGRIKTEKWGPRIIDIDILFYGDEIIDEPQLKVPHPFIQERRFTLTPLCDIAPSFKHPLLNKTMEELLDICTDNSEVKLWER